MRVLRNGAGRWRRVLGERTADPPHACEGHEAAGSEPGNAANTHALMIAARFAACAARLGPPKTTRTTRACPASSRQRRPRGLLALLGALRVLLLGALRVLLLGRSRCAACTRGRSARSRHHAHLHRELQAAVEPPQVVELAVLVDV